MLFFCPTDSISAERTVLVFINLLQLELKKAVLDRMVHLFSRGFVIPVVTYIKNCLDKQDTDISLIRHFVTEVSNSHFFTCYHY